MLLFVVVSCLSLKTMENVERGTPPTHQTAATTAFSCSEGVSWRLLGRILGVVQMFPRRPKAVHVGNSATRRPKTEQGGIVCRPCWTTKRKRWLRDVPKMFTRRLETVYVGNSVGRAQRASERSERSEQSDQDGLGELPSESCSKDALRVREGRLRKAIQHVSPRGFTCNALPVPMLLPGF